MEHVQIIKCLHCTGTSLRKNGHSENDTQCWHCNSCGKNFQSDYRNNARKPGVKDKIAEMTLNGSGVREISRNLRIAQGTVMSELKKSAARKPICHRYA